MKQAINTRTREEYDALMRYCHSKGMKTPAQDSWYDFGENTCVIIDEREGAFFSGIRYYKSQGYSIIPYTEFAKANIEPDYKALYLEGRELLKSCACCIPEYNTKLQSKISEYLTNHKDGE